MIGLWEIPNGTALTEVNDREVWEREPDEVFTWQDGVFRLKGKVDQWTGGSTKRSVALDLTHSAFR